jgi:hypothetical protein
LTKNKIADFDHAQVQAPLVIGIAGHIDLRENDRLALEASVQEILLTLHKEYSETPLILVSALAEGADRLAAKAALSSHLGVRLIVPIPMPVDLYELDFDTASRKEFRALLDQAEAWFELPLAVNNTRETIAKHGPHRDLQYEALGKFIARQSQYLIALWDGVNSDRRGGTASVVHFQLEGVPGPDPCALEDPEGFPVFHILTPRQKNSPTHAKVKTLPTIYPKVFQGNNDRAEEYYAMMFGRLNEFNEYVRHAARDLAHEIERSSKDLLPVKLQNELPAGMGPDLNRYALADARALQFHQRWFWVQVILHVGTFLSFFCFLLFVHGESRWIGFLALSWTLLIVLVFLFLLARIKSLDTQYENYRAMAEGLRVRFFWKLAGIKESVADHYLGKQRSELDWIRHGFRGWNVAEDREDHGRSHSLDLNDQRNRLGFVHQHWIDHQKAYFSRSAKCNLRIHELLEWSGIICIGGVLALGLVFLFPCVRSDKAIFDCVAITLEALLATAALVHHFNNRMAYAAYAKQYGRMKSLFANGSHLIGTFLNLQDYKNACCCVEAVGREALAENGDWVLLRRDRPLEIPHP